MPLLQGQPFKLIKPPDTYPIGSEVYIIQHTGEKFLNKSDYEDRLALYRQSIWTCQCTGHTGLTHKEAWMSEAKVRVAAKTAVPLALQRPLLVLVHHSLSPLEQLIDAASVLCYSQYHVGEELLLLHPPKQVQVRVAKSKDIPKMCTGSTNGQSMANGLITCEEDNVSLLNGNTHDMSKGDSPGTSPGKENQAKETQTSKDENPNRKGMLPKLYDVITLEDQKLIENVPAKNLLRPYKVPSKDQLRLFIRSCALRHRGTTCTPWVVADDLIRKFNIPNKLPSVFLSSPKPNHAPAKRKAQSPASEYVKRAKSESLCNKVRENNVAKVPPLIIQSQNSYSGVKSSSTKKLDPSKMFKFSVKQNSHTPSPVRIDSKPPWVPPTKHPLSLGKPNIFSRPSNISAPTLTPMSVPRKRGRPRLSKEEKERNKKMKQATLLELSNKIQSVEGKLNVVKIKTNCEMPRPPLQAPATYPKPAHPLIMSPYRSPVKRANSPETIMKLPFMRRFLHEHKTIKGVLGQFRRYAHTMDLVLSKLSPAQIEMIPIESLRHDLLNRQKKVRDKKFFETLTPEQRKQFLKDKARTVALERWKERKLKNLKIEDKTISGLLPLPEPSLVETPKPIPNSLFGDIVLVTEFIKCFHELLLGEEKFQVTTFHIMEAITAGSQGCIIIADIFCCLLPLVIHDDICKNCKEIGVPISSIPVTYQTAQELTRLCLRKQDEEESALSASEENYLIGKEKTELSDELLAKLECCELWELNCKEIVAVLTALVHKALCTAALSVFVEEVEEKVLQTLRERRKFLKQVQREQKAGVEKRKEERLQNRIAKGVAQKKQRGRPRGFSPKLGNITALPDYFGLKENEEKQAEKEAANDSKSISSVVQNRRLSAEIQKKEKADLLRLEKERQKQFEENQKRQAIDRKYEEIVFRRDNLLRRTPIGFDRNHNRYWIFHSTTPGLYVEKGWVNRNSDYTYSLHQAPSIPDKWSQSGPSVTPVVVKSETVGSEDEDEKPLSIIVAKSKNNDDEDNKPLSFVMSKIKKEMDEDNRPLSTVKSKLSLSPMKMTYRGRPPKEAYVLVDEDTQTFPAIEENKWYCYQNMEEVKALLSCLSDQGQRESQLIAAININKEKLQYHFNNKPEPLTVNLIDFSHRLKESLKEDIIQIEKELIEGWLGGVPTFNEWENKALEANDVSTLGELLIEAQGCMQIKYLKSIMAPIREILVPATEGTPAEYEDVEGIGVQWWRDEVKSCRTYSRLHVLVGVFDSCIKWEKSMATRKCKICRSKVKEDPLIMCSKCENSYHMYCLRPPLKEDPGEMWNCQACMPKKIRREETHTQPIESEPVATEQDEKNDPTYTLESDRKPLKKKKKAGLSIRSTEQHTKQERECVICFGRVGLIVCSKCSTAYHSECHDPPLLSRARKDWVCGVCVNPSKAKSNLRPMEDDEEKPLVRRNYFGNIEEIVVRKRSGNAGPRDKFGRFLRGGIATSSVQLPSISMGEEETEKPEVSTEEQEDLDEPMDKFGRSIRGAKAKALENMDSKYKILQDSRRSTRKCDKPKNYKDESEEESSDKEDEESETEDDNESEYGGRSEIEYPAESENDENQDRRNNENEDAAEDEEGEDAVEEDEEGEDAVEEDEEVEDAVEEDEEVEDVVEEDEEVEDVVEEDEEVEDAVEEDEEVEDVVEEDEEVEDVVEEDEEVEDAVEEDEEVEDAVEENEEEDAAEDEEEGGEIVEDEEKGETSAEHEGGKEATDDDDDGDESESEDESSSSSYDSDDDESGNGEDFVIDKDDRAEDAAMNPKYSWQPSGS